MELLAYLFGDLVGQSKQGVAVGGAEVVAESLKLEPPRARLVLVLIIYAM